MAEEKNLAFELHYTVQDLAVLWRYDSTTVRELFRDEPDVIRLGKAGRRDGKRDYVNIRIPASVANRVHRRLTGA